VRGGSIGPHAAGSRGCIGNIYCAIGAQTANEIPGRVNVYDGDVTGTVQASQGAEVHILGGTLTDVDLRTLDVAYMEISGGDFVDPTLLAFDESWVDISGSGFNYPPGPISSTSGTLTGMLDDGTPITLPFARASTATIELPEPSALTALGSGIAPTWGSFSPIQVMSLQSTDVRFSPK
jgi:hypothetical protein